MKINNTYQKKARIELIPLIDSIFLVLVFFMYAMMSMVVHRGIPVDVPEAVSSVINKQKYVSITVTRNNKIFIDNEQITFSELTPFLSDRMKNNKEIEVYINADEKAYHGYVIKVLDKVRNAGIYKISFEVEQEDEG